MKIEHLGQHRPQHEQRLPCYLSAVPAGFPSPADDYMDSPLDLNTHLITHPAATFYCRVSGSSMQDLGIFDGDLLIVDRAITPQQGHVVIAVVAGEMTCKQLDLHHRRLLPANPAFSPIVLTEGSSLVIEGVVIYSIRSHHVRPGRL